MHDDISMNKNALTLGYNYIYFSYSCVVILKPTQFADEALGLIFTKWRY